MTAVHVDCDEDGRAGSNSITPTGFWQSRFDHLEELLKRMDQ